MTVQAQPGCVLSKNTAWATVSELNKSLTRFWTWFLKPNLQMSTCRDRSRFFWRRFFFFASSFSNKFKVVPIKPVIVQLLISASGNLQKQACVRAIKTCLEHWVPSWTLCLNYRAVLWSTVRANGAGIMIADNPCRRWWCLLLAACCAYDHSKFNKNHDLHLIALSFHPDQGQAAAVTRSVKSRSIYI